MELSKKYARFVQNCFNNDYFHKYRFNYGDDNFVRHKVVNTPLPAYIQTKHALHTHDWMAYVKILIDRYADKDWFAVTRNLYGTQHDMYLVVEYNGWQDVYNRKRHGKIKRVFNSGPNDTPVDVFWLYIIDMVYSKDYTCEEITRVFKQTIWFYICEEHDVAVSDLSCTTNDYVCKFYSQT
ncbi:ORF114 [Betabaculovirus altermyunipunctae]|uniref:ORF114 n=1 Tax=Betabaculovirus altermyunipunctae TaxID=3051996 RepID=A0A1S5YE09_9BBAC|nr:ORF114 [Betabaculovirus altermyunipunctae]AQQ80381.1 ORF114 [Betabaculovirus altermyunipunctae]